MAILNSYERGILAKFKNGAKIESKEEWEVLKEWATVGFITFGFLSGCARLTDEGKFALNR